jgi:hypothetical protein
MADASSTCAKGDYLPPPPLENLRDQPGLGACSLPIWARPWMTRSQGVPSGTEDTPSQHRVGSSGQGALGGISRRYAIEQVSSQ